MPPEKQKVTKLTRFSYVINKKDYKDDEIKNLKKDLTVTPFKPGNYGKYAKNTSFSLYVDTETRIGIPRFYGIEKFGDPSINKLDAYNHTVLDMKYKGDLRPNQKIIVDKIIAGLDSKKGGLLIAGCGIGKTNMAIYIACHYGLKTLFIVHKEFLMRQAINRIKEFTNVQTVGIIQQKRVETQYPFTVAMVHSLAKKDYPDELFKDYGLIIIDEVHHMAARNFSNVFQKMTAKYMLGISAESTRNDKLYKIINWYMGPFLHIEPQKPNKMVIVKKFNYMTTNDKRIKVIYNKYHDPDRSKMVTNLTKIKKRNRFALKLIEELYDQDKHILCLTGRVKQVNKLYKLLQENPLTKGNVGKYLGGMKEMQLTRSAKKQIILGTYAMAEEGLDIPHLNVVMLLTPKSSIKQSVGRILRKDVYKERPIVIDFNDDNEVFQRQSNVRNKYFRDQKYNIQNFYVSDYELDGHFMYDDTESIREKLLELPDPKNNDTEKKFSFAQQKVVFDSFSD